jgi:hypothetical protein
MLELLVMKEVQSEKQVHQVLLIRLHNGEIEPSKDFVINQTEIDTWNPPERSPGRLLPLKHTT